MSHSSTEKKIQVGGLDIHGTSVPRSEETESEVPPITPLNDKDTAYDHVACPYARILMHVGVLSGHMVSSVEIADHGGNLEEGIEFKGFMRAAKKLGMKPKKTRLRDKNVDEVPTPFVLLPTADSDPVLYVSREGEEFITYDPLSQRKSRVASFYVPRGVMAITLDVPTIDDIMEEIRQEIDPPEIAVKNEGHDLALSDEEKARLLTDSPNDPNHAHCPFTACLVRLGHVFNQHYTTAQIDDLAGEWAQNLNVKTFTKIARHLNFDSKSTRFRDARHKQYDLPFLLMEGGQPRLYLIRQKDHYMVFDPNDLKVHKVPFGTLPDQSQMVALKPRSNLAKARADFGRVLTESSWGLRVESALGAIFSNLLSLTAPFAAYMILEKVLPAQNFSLLQLMTGGLFLALVFGMFLHFIRAHLSSLYVFHQAETISRVALSHLFGDNQSLANKGHLITWVAQAERAGSAFRHNRTMMVVDILFSALILGMMTAISPALALVTAGVIPLLILIPRYFNDDTRRHLQHFFQERSRRLSVLLETLEGTLTVRALRAEPVFYRKLVYMVRKTARYLYRADRLTRTLRGVNQLLVLATLVLLTYMSVQEILVGRMNVGTCLAILLLAMQALAPFRQMPSYYRALNEAEETTDQLTLLRPLVQAGRDMKVRPEEKAAGKYQFNNVSFNYHPYQAPTIRQARFAIAPGSMFGVLGSVGSGKTSLVNLLQGLYHPTDGQVILDGHDVREILPDWLSENIVVVPQEPTLFSGTIHENIAFGLDVPEADIVAACKMVGVHYFIEQFPDGYNTVLGLRGHGLSLGQKQLICIARAVLRKPQILILDEATSTLDKGREEKLLQNLRQIFEDRTIILTTKRTAPLAYCSQAGLLVNGKIVHVAAPNDIVNMARNQDAFAYKGSFES